MYKNEIATVRRDLQQYEDPAHDLICKMLTLFENAKNTNSKKCFDLGFTNSRNVKQNDSISMRRDYNVFIRNYLKMLEIYGENAIMVTQKEFIDIVNRYNLFCGPFKNYHGEIPSNQIDEIDVAKKKLWLGRLVNLHPYKLYCLSAIEFKNRIDEGSYEQIMRFPFYDEDLSFGGRAMIAQRHGNMGIGRYYFNEQPNLFIAAPKSQIGVMKLLEYERLRQQGRKQSKWFQEIQQEREKQWVQQDPLICTWIPNIGIIIHTAWGTEANDKLLEMRKVINHFITEVINDLNPLYGGIYQLLTN